MADYRPICQCGQRFQGHKMGVQVKYAQGMVQHGDEYKCPGCGHRIITSLGKPRMESED